MDAVRLCGEIVKETAEATKDKERIRSSSLFVIPLDTIAEYPPIKFTPTSFAALSSVCSDRGLEKESMHIPGRDQYQYFKYFPDDRGWVF